MHTEEIEIAEADRAINTHQSTMIVRNAWDLQCYLTKPLGVQKS